MEFFFNPNLRIVKYCLQTYFLNHNIYVQNCIKKKN